MKNSQFDAIIYTDGGCFNNGDRKGDGAWAFVEYDINTDIVLVHCGAMRGTTNNRAEMMAIINGIKHYPNGMKILVISDSGYVVKGYNHPSYLDSWIKNGWCKSDGKPVLNIDLWLDIIGLTYNHSIKFNLIKGHYKDPNQTHALWNSIVDKACTTVLRDYMEYDYIVLKYDINTKIFTKI